MANRSNSDDKKEATTTVKKVKSKKQKKMSFAQAQDVYLRLKQEKEEEKQRAREEKEKRNETIQATNKSRKKMNQALAKKNKKGQPNLNAQMDVLLERIQKRVDTEKKEKKFMEPENPDGPRKPVKPFLRKGQGTARFGMPKPLGQPVGPPAASSPLIQLPRFTPTNSIIPTSARTLDSGYSNEDETRPPTTTSLPIDRQSVESPAENEHIPPQNRTPMVLEEEEDEGHGDDDHLEHHEEVSAQPTFFPDSEDTEKSTTASSAHSSGARRFRQMADEMHEQRKRIQTMHSVSLTPSSYASSDLSGPLGASTPIHQAQTPAGPPTDPPTPPQQANFPTLSDNSLETPISSRPFASNRVNLMQNEAQTGISLLQRRPNIQNQNQNQNSHLHAHLQGQKENLQNLPPISEHVYDQPIQNPRQQQRLQNPNSNPNSHRGDVKVRNLMIQLRDAIAHTDYADEQVRSAAKRILESFEAKKKEMEENFRKKREELEEDFGRKMEMIEEENREEKERLARERRDLERDRKAVNKESNGKYKELVAQIATLKEKLNDSETRNAKIRQTIRAKEENEKKKEEELEKKTKESDRWKRNAETLEKKVRELRAEKAKWEKEEELRIREEMRRIAGNRGRANLNQSLGSAGFMRQQARIPAATNTESHRKSSTGSSGSRRTVSFADERIPEEEVYEEEEEVFEQSLGQIMSPVERFAAPFGPCTVWRDQLGSFTKVTKTADDGRFFEYPTGEFAWFTASRSVSWTRRTNGTIVMHLSAPNILITYFHDRQVEITRPNGNITLISQKRADIRTEVHRDQAFPEGYAQLFDRSGKCRTIDRNGIKNASYKSGDTCSFRDSDTRYVKIESSFDDFELIEPEFRLRWFKGVMLSMKILARPMSGEKTLTLKLQLHDGSGWIEAVEKQQKTAGQTAKTKIFSWPGV